MICLPVLAISRWFWLHKFRFGEMRAEQLPMMSRHRHICYTRRVCAKRNLRRKNFTIWFYLWQQHPFPRPVSSESKFSFRLMGLCLVTWHATRFIINLAPPRCRVASREDGRIGREVFNREGPWGTIDDLTTSFLHFSLFSTALLDLANSRPVHSLVLSSHLFPRLPRLLPPFTLSWKMVLAIPDERETWPHHRTLRLFTMIMRSSCGPIACLILARTFSLVTSKTLGNKTFQLFIELTMKSEDGDAVTSPSNRRLAALSQHCLVFQNECFFYPAFVCRCFRLSF